MPLPDLPHDFVPLPASPGESSRRMHQRNTLRCAVTIALAGGSERSGTTVDLSRDGLSLSTDKPISPGSRCTLRLHAASRAETLSFEVKAVYSSYTAPGDFRIGVVFTEPEPEYRDLLRALAEQS